MWDLWWTECQWDRFLPEYFGITLSVSFHGAPLLGKTEKLIMFLIFVTGSDNKSQGCGASVASVAGSFSTKKKVM
jgi:hypothetical protein